MTWISVEDRLPCTEGELVIAFGSGNTFIGFYDKTFVKWRDIHMYSPRFEVTHWMPLPAPPQEPIQ